MATLDSVNKFDCTRIAIRTIQTIDFELGEIDRRIQRCLVYILWPHSQLDLRTANCQSASTLRYQLTPALPICESLSKAEPIDHGADKGRLWIGPHSCLIFVMSKLYVYDYQSAP